MKLLSVHERRFASGRRKARLLFAVTALPLMLAACDQIGQETAQEARPAGQVVAVVDGHEITIHQVNAELRRMSSQAAGSEDELSKRVLRDIVEREMLASQAMKAELDRRPRVLLELDRARALVLAQAYVQESMGRMEPPGDQVIDQFIAENPGLFDNRQVYTFDQIVLARQDYNDDMGPMIDEAESLDQIAEVFTASGVDFERTLLVRRAEEFPPEMVKQMSGIAPGENVVLRSDAQVALMRLLDLQKVPISMDSAKEAARRFVSLRQTQDAANEIRLRVRGESDVQFFGKFAELNEEYRTAEEASPTQGQEAAKEAPEGGEAVREGVQ